MTAPSWLGEFIALIRNRRHLQIRHEPETKMDVPNMSDYNNLDFDDNYSSCNRTYVTLSFYHRDRICEDITNYLNIEPTRSANREDSNSWHFSTQEFVESRDFRRHIIYLLSMLDEAGKPLSALSDSGWVFRLHCFWESMSGNGGPEMDCKLMTELGRRELDLHFDIWFS